MATKAGRYDEVLLGTRGTSTSLYALNSDSIEVEVFESDGTTAATLYDDRDKTAYSGTGSIVTPDDAGNLEFFADPGIYVLEIRDGSTVLRTDTVNVAIDGVESGTLASVTSNETVTGEWDFTGGIKENGTELSGTYARPEDVLTVPTTPKLTRSADNPFFTVTDSALSSIYWPWILNVEDLIASPRGTYYMWYSTDHDSGAGGIALAWANDLDGPWTDVGTVYTDTTTGTQTETPSVIWNDATSEFWMYYHNDGLGFSQSTALAKSTDGETWTRFGKVLDVPDTTQFPGSGHTGYFRPFLIGDRWFGYHLMGSGDWPHFGLSYSYDGEVWHTDPRPLAANNKFAGDPDRQLLWNHSNIVQWQGQLWWVGATSNFVSGGPGSDDKKIAMAPIADNLRTLLSPPRIVLEASEAWETTALRSVYAFVDGRDLHVAYYMSSGGFGLATVEAR